MRWSLLALLMTLSGACAGVAPPPAPSPPLEGKWQLVEEHRLGADQGPQPFGSTSLMIFSGEHYSMIYVAMDLGEVPTAYSAQRVFRQLIMNTGTYEFDGSTLVRHVIISNTHPDHPAAAWTYERDVRLEGDDLWVMTESSTDRINYRWTRIAD